MKLQLVVSAAALAFAAFVGNPVFAQMNMDHGKMGMAATPDMTNGEVRKIDKEAGKITIKHGDIKHMDMPGMTMVFVVKNKALPLILVCPLGARAGRAVAVAKKLGYEQAQCLGGGLKAWREANMPVEKA